MMLPDRRENRDDDRLPAPGVQTPSIRQRSKPCPASPTPSSTRKPETPASSAPAATRSRRTRRPRTAARTRGRRLTSSSSRRSPPAPRSRCAWSPRARAGSWERSTSMWSWRRIPRPAPTASAGRSPSAGRSARSRRRRSPRSRRRPRSPRRSRPERPWRRNSCEPARLGSGDVELDRDVVARRVRIRADLLVRLAGERGELGLRQAPVLHAELHREAEAPAFARADRDRAGDARLGSVLLLALADEVERAAEAGGVAGGEEVLGRRRAGLARPAHLLGHREIGLHHAVARLGVAVAPAGGGRRCGEEGLDRVHAGLRKKSGL